MRPNAGAQLKAELSVLPDSLLNPTNSSDLMNAGENLMTEGEKSGEKSASYDPYFMCPSIGDRTGADVDPADTVAAASSGSAADLGSPPRARLRSTGRRIVCGRDSAVSLDSHSCGCATRSGQHRPADSTD